MAFQPNTTPTPNWLYNGEMRKMNETELKVVLLVTRKTLGWFNPTTCERKQQDYISQSQFMEFTGQSHTAIAQAIQKSVEKGWIIARDSEGNLCDTSEKRRRRKVWYQLGNIFIDKISKQQSGQDENLSNNLAKSKQHNASNLSNNLDNTKETITKEIITKRESVQIQEINEIIDYTLKVFNLDKLDGSFIANRISARQIIEQTGNKENAKRIIVLAKQHPYWGDRITKLSTIEKNMRGIVRDLEGEQIPESLSNDPRFQ